MGGTPNRRATFVRWVSVDEPVAELAAECKALTWDTAREHAVLRIVDGRRMIVNGGQYGIELELAIPNGDPFGRPDGSLWAPSDDGEQRVVELVLHTHPQVTGPSDDDLRVLAELGQATSLLFEIFGPVEGTVIKPKGAR